MNITRLVHVVDDGIEYLLLRKRFTRRPSTYPLYPWLPPKLKFILFFALKKIVLLINDAFFENFKVIRINFTLVKKSEKPRSEK